MNDKEAFDGMLAALKGVVRVADRKTVEFDAARAAIAKAEAASNGETSMVLGTGKERPLSLSREAGRDPEARFESASLHQLRGWILHWVDDVTAGLKPTEQSLRVALAEIDAVIAKAEAVPTLEGERVRELEWYVPSLSSKLKRADTILGIYRVWTHAEAGGKWWWQTGDAHHEGQTCEATSESDAFAACQSDFNHRILSALASPAQKDEGR